MLLSMGMIFTSCDDDDDEIVVVDPTGSLIVEDQFVAETDNAVLVEQVILSQDGWVVVHRDNGNNAPDVADIISEPVFLEAGTHVDVLVPLEEGVEVAQGERLWVMLHADTGLDEVFEFAGVESPDQPITDDADNVVAASLVNNPTFDENTESVAYPLVQVDGSGISGTATFFRAERGDGAYVVLDVEGTPAGGNHPAHIHEDTAGSGGDIVIPLTNVDGDEGTSLTFVSEQTFDELLTFDGHINIHVSPEDLAVVSTGNIGANGSPLTGESKVYTLEERALEGVNGTATFWELEDGTALVELMLENTPEDGIHPAHIHVNSAAEGGAIAISLNPVTGGSGQSFTFVDMFDDGSPVRAGEAVTFDELLLFDGYINVHLSPEDLATIVAQGDIGENELTGESTVYPLVSVDETTDVNGTVTFHERLNGNTLVVIDVENTIAGSVHPAHIHEGVVGSNGTIAISLNPVDGDTGMSMTDVATFDEGFNGGEAISYSELLAYNGYVNVHLSPDELATVVASGNIGANAD